MRKRTTDVGKVNKGLDRIGGVVQSSPGLAARTRAMLAGDLPCPDLEAEPMGRMLHVPMRIPERMVARADALIPLLEGDPRLELSGAVVRAKVLRLALAVGLAQLERDTAERASTAPTAPTAKPKRRGG
ncbi:MAG: hypothetical protein JXB32_18045 [Deltaproteobacteria bacterium]|nr:hypothetical protein [Deltaproteobacteria bacterium]